MKLKAKVKAIPLAEKPTAKLEVTTTPHCYGVSNLNFVTTTETVADYFSKFGDLVKVEVLNNKSLGRVNITFSKMFDVKSLKVSKHIIDQRVLKISEPLGGDYDDQTRSVRISGLFANLAESHIIAYFQKFGKIIKWTNSISKHDGFKCTFVKFENYDSAEKVAGKSNLAIIHEFLSMFQFHRYTQTHHLQYRDSSRQG